MNITTKQARKVLETIDAGLTVGLGKAAVGECCVEAAICLALGEKHSERPTCVEWADRNFAIATNDNFRGTKTERAAALRQLGVYQLGTKDTIRAAWAGVLSRETIKLVLPPTARAVAERCTDDDLRGDLLAAADRCEQEGSRDAALAMQAASAAAYAATGAAYAAADAASAAGAAAYAAASAAYDAYAADDAASAAGAAAAASHAAAAYAASAADGAADGAADAARRRIILLSIFAAQIAYEETGSPGLDLWREMEASGVV